MTDPSFIIAPNPVWSARNLVGDAAIGAFLFTYQNLTRINKATYSDPGGRVINANPLQLDSKGEATIYWATDQLYSIAIYQPDGALIYTADNYPTVGSGSGGDITINEIAVNLVRNPQFYSWGQGNPQLITTSTNYTRLGTTEPICDDWLFVRDNTNATVAVNRGNLALGESIFPGNPVFYLDYQCTNVGSGGENLKHFSQKFESVQTLQNMEVSGSIWCSNPGSSDATITLKLVQNFGTGGSPSPEEHIGLATVTVPAGSVMQISGSATVTPTTGLSIGTNGDDSIIFVVTLPLNQVCHLGFSAAQLHASSTLPDFPISTPNDQLKNIDDNTIYASFLTGDVKPTIRNVADPGWLLMDDNTIGNYFSNATSMTGNQCINLFILLWNNVSNTYATIYNSNGSPGTRGSTAIADWNANKQIQLPLVLGRAMCGAGQGAGLQNYGYGSNHGTETVTLTVAQIPPHTHQYERWNNQYFFGLTEPGDVWSADHTVNTSDGSESGLDGSPHPNIQPSVYFSVMMKL